MRSEVLQAGRYMFIVHYCQPEHTAFPIEVLLDSGELWKGENTIFKLTFWAHSYMPMLFSSPLHSSPLSFKTFLNDCTFSFLSSGQINTSFCPSVSGCRSVVVAERRISLDVLQQTLSITLKIPYGKTLTLVRTRLPHCIPFFFTPPGVPLGADWLTNTMWEVFDLTFSTHVKILYNKKKEKEVMRGGDLAVRVSLTQRAWERLCDRLPERTVLAVSLRAFSFLSAFFSSAVHRKLK